MEVYDEVLCRLKESDDEDAALPGFEDELWAHFNRLPTRYALDVNAERAQDVLMHKRLLQLAHNPETSPAIEVRLVQVPYLSHGHYVDSANSGSLKSTGLQHTNPLKKRSIYPPPAFGSSTDMEFVYKNSDMDFSVMHEITISTHDKPTLLSQTTVC